MTGLFAFFVSFGVGFCVASMIHNKKDSLMVGAGLTLVSFIPLMAEIGKTL